jgi:limonene-1,2-epoxide hydrolase
VATRETLFADIDSMEPDRFAAHLAADVTMRFGNAEPVHGRDAVRNTWAGFCQTVDGVHHDLVEQWHPGDATIVESDVTYTRKDHSRVTVPVVTIYRERDDEIADYRVFIDLAPLFAEAEVAGAAPDTVSG